MIIINNDDDNIDNYIWVWPFCTNQIPLPVFHYIIFSLSLSVVLMLKTFCHT